MFLSLTLFFTLSWVVLGQRNVTVDDNDPSIIYQPNVDQWGATNTNSLDFGPGETHHLTSDAGATAIFGFTGIPPSSLPTCISEKSRLGTAVYFYAPLWPYHVT